MSKILPLYLSIATSQIKQNIRYDKMMNKIWNTQKEGDFKNLLTHKATIKRNKKKRK